MESPLLFLTCQQHPCYLSSSGQPSGCCNASLSSAQLSYKHLFQRMRHTSPGAVCWCHVLKEVSSATLMTFSSLYSLCVSKQRNSSCLSSCRRWIRSSVHWRQCVSHYPACTLGRCSFVPGRRRWTAETQTLMLPAFAPKLGKAQIKHGPIAPWAVTRLRERVLDNKVPDQATILSWFVGPLFLWFSVLILAQEKHWSGEQHFSL